MGSERFGFDPCAGQRSTSWVRSVEAFVDEAVALWADSVVVLPEVSLWDSAETCSTAVEVEVVL